MSFGASSCANSDPHPSRARGLLGAIYPLGMRGLTSPRLLAIAAALLGATSIVSAVTPEFADRLHAVSSVFGRDAPTVARTLVVAFGLALLLLSRGLARRKRRAWQLAFALVVATAAAHLVKGLDVEESLISVGFLAALWAGRREFVAPGDPESVRPLTQVLLALVVVMPIAVLHLVGEVAYSDIVDDGILILISALGLRAIAIWLRPTAEKVRNIPAERHRAEELVREFGRDSLAYFSLRRDKSLFFSASGMSFLAYGVVGGTAIVTGEPVGVASERPELLAEFQRVAHSKGWRVAIAGVSSEWLRDVTDLGFRSLYLGDEALVHPAKFSLDGRPIRKVRQSVTRLAKAGYTVEILCPADIQPALRNDLREVSAEWRGNWPERGFTMAMDALFEYDDAFVVVGRGPDGKVGGFLQLVPSPAASGYSLSQMRRRRDTPNGLMEYLIVETIAWAKNRDVAELSLNFSVAAEYLRADGGLLRTLLLAGDRLFQLERLHSFNRKFFPEWRRRYLCFERWTDLPAVAISYLQAESLLTPPSPWAGRTPDVSDR